MLDLFQEFDSFLRSQGFEARKDQIVDASIVAVQSRRTIVSRMPSLNLARKWMDGPMHNVGKRTGRLVGQERTDSSILFRRIISPWM
ncbi:hypothetical protein DBT_1987 [Dissulfuribacter thermophilus]|uniref:Uncharacterized protein n=1 Tax=Dissulfuribacter thermophilus TaxID=1156395 RepID=A0A1B9F420_9BACT|nr:hypothetical protein [Dissulfuribacter thermophilus]OCC14672.1 hypothetical protein DBT_1987 [Dissulfuribacter thermophilus]